MTFSRSRPNPGLPLISRPPRRSQKPPATNERTKAIAAAKELQGAVASDDAKKSLSTTKDLRDRFYTLTLEPLHDLRAFASFAFRKDKTNNRRAAFASAYIRRQNHKSRAKTAEPTPINDSF